MTACDSTHRKSMKNVITITFIHNQQMKLLPEFKQRQSERVAALKYDDGFEHAAIRKLFMSSVRCKYIWFLHVVRLDASNVMRFGTV